VMVVVLLLMVRSYALGSVPCERRRFVVR
jgi:hypothetical protein